MNECACLIPYHKYEMTYLEKLALNRIYDVFANRTCYLLLPSYIDPNKFISMNLDQNIIDKYIKYHNNFYYVNFGDEYFKSSCTYNALVLHENTYNYFKNLGFNYVLICQLDAFIFEDKLDYFLEKNYDFIGSFLSTYLNTWMENEIIDNYCEHLLTKNIFMNGGFSLRNIDFCINAINNYHDFIYDTLIPEFLDGKNNHVNEDDFFSQNVYNIPKALDIFNFCLSGYNAKNYHFIINYEYPMAIHYILDNEKCKYPQFLINKFLQEQNIFYNIV